MADSTLQEAQSEYNALLAGFQSIQLATVSRNNHPEASYAPAVVDDAGNFYVYVSELSSHTANLLQEEKASVMLIEDEATCAQIFARKRITFRCNSYEITGKSTLWNEIISRFENKFGPMIKQLKTMQDFHLIQLAPKKGRLVYGFGKAFDLTGENLQEVSHVSGLNGKGHRTSKEVPLSSADITRIVDHMNDDHADSVLAYVKHFAEIPEATAAKLLALNTSGMDIQTTINKKEELIRVAFDHPLQSSHDAHVTMVQMSKEAKKALSNKDS